MDEVSVYDYSTPVHRVLLEPNLLLGIGIMPAMLILVLTIVLMNVVSIWCVIIGVTPLFFHSNGKIEGGEERQDGSLIDIGMLSGAVNQLVIRLSADSDEGHSFGIGIGPHGAFGEIFQHKGIESGAVAYSMHGGRDRSVSFAGNGHFLSVIPEKKLDLNHGFGIGFIGMRLAFREHPAEFQELEGTREIDESIVENADQAG